jgi:inhibitor of cysteine peptidase
MERKIKKQTLLYGFAAILLVAALSTLSYNLVNLSESPPAPPSPASPSALLATFSSYETLKSFLMLNSKTQGPFLFLSPLDINMGPVRTLIESSQNVYFTAPGLSLEAMPTSDLKYSTTNIQVTGVDEADTTKTDGKYIYQVSGSSIFILKAYPPDEAEIVSTIPLSNINPVGIFVSQDSSRLAVLGCKYNFPEYYSRNFVIDVKSFVNVYDISDKSEPVLLRNLTMTGSYFNSRMMGKYVYFVVSQPAYVIYDTVILPKIYSDGQVKEIVPSEIHYSNSSDNYYQYTTFIAVNMEDTAEAPTYLTLMLGGTSSMYVSSSNLYLTYPEVGGNTSIFRVRIEANNMTCEANGKVFGRELNQFSMDERDSYFRIATATWLNGTPSSNLYILNMNLTIIGKLENIEPNENLDSARFIGNRCYLSTSVVRRDPFFVIDVENESSPQILGYLKIPGFTRYLHPYDADHIIGIGKDGNNVRISLFDVSNVSAPRNMSEYKVEGYWSDTLVLTDHKAFLFDYNKTLLAIPVSIGYYDNYSYSMWQGLYVFDITLDSGIVQRGTIAHQETGANYLDNSYYVKRSLYIENVLYTVSDKKIKMNSLDDLAPINVIELP